MPIPPILPNSLSPPSFDPLQRPRGWYSPLSCQSHICRIKAKKKQSGLCSRRVIDRTVFVITGKTLINRYRQYNVNSANEYKACLLFAKLKCDIQTLSIPVKFNIPLQMLAHWVAEDLLRTTTSLRTCYTSHVRLIFDLCSDIEISALG